MVKKILIKLLKFYSYLALVVVFFGALSLFGPFILGLCQNQSGGTVACDTQLIRSIYEFGFTIVMMSIYLGFPILLAIAGLIFLCLNVIWKR